MLYELSRERNGDLGWGVHCSSVRIEMIGD